MAKSSVDAYGAKGEQKVLLMDPDDLVLVTDPNHPLYDARVNLPISEEMIASLLAHGVIHAVQIRKNPETGAVEVAAGRQRVKAAREANKRLREAGKEILLVRCMAAKGQDGAALFGMSVAENEIRTPDSPLGRAEKARRMIELGRSEEQVGVAMGVSPSTVRNMLAVLDACKAVKSALESEKITASVAYTLARLKPEEQRERLEKVLEEAPRAAGTKRGRKGSGQKAADIAGGTTRPKVRSAKSVLAFRETLLAADVMPVVDVLDWLLGKKDTLDLPRVLADAHKESALPNYAGGYDTPGTVEAAPELTTELDPGAEAAE
jgi:ParB family chromosome partitioning protein